MNLKALSYNATLWVALLFAPGINAGVTPSWYVREFNVMGTRARVELLANSQSQAESLQAAVESDMRAIDERMSPYKETSELSLLNREGHLHPVTLSADIYGVIKTSLKYSDLTNGAFDITFSSVGYLYDYRAHTRPTEKAISENIAGINYRHLIFDEQHSSVAFSRKGTRIDLGGIAKGHAVDRAINILKAAGIKNAYVSAGGDSYALGDKNGRPWFIAIKHPRDENKILLSIPLQDLAVSTSGDYERYFDEGGVRYHHIINPKTGDSARNSQSVTILADDSITADALSTSIFIMGPEKGLALINQLPGISAVVVDKEGKVHYSADLVKPAQ